MRKIKYDLSEESCDEIEAATLNQTSPAAAIEGAAEEVQWTWKRGGRQMKKAKLHLYSRRTIVEQIAEELKLVGNGVYEEFTKSCFGFLMRLDTQGVACNGALHCLFAREVIKADAGPDELWYRVGGRFIRFSKYEYALVTGLSFRPTTFDPSAQHHPPASGLFLRHYGGQNLTMDDLRRHFTDGVFRGSPADALKVAKLLIIYFLLFGMPETNTYIDEWAWSLVEDADQWETFMWGKYTYQILLSHLQHLPTEIKHSVTPSYRVCGYVWAFLTWAFEAIPEFGVACGILTFDDVLPRCLRWRFRRATQVDTSGFFDRQMEVHPKLEPRAEEKREPYWEHVNDNLRYGVCYIHPRNKPLKKMTTSQVNPSAVDVLPISRPQRSRSTGTLCPCHTSAAPMIGKRKRDDPLTTRASRKVAGQEKTAQKELLRIVQQDLPSVIRQEVHQALKEFLSRKDSVSPRYTSDDLHTTAPDKIRVQCDEAEVGAPAVPQGFEKYKCMDTMVVKMGNEIEELRRENLGAIKTIEKLRLKQLEADKVVEELKRKNLEANLKILESDKAVEVYKSMKIEEEDLANMLPRLVNDVPKLAISEGGNSDTRFKCDKDNPGNGSRNSGLSKKGNITTELNGLSDEASSDDSDQSWTDSRMDDLIASLHSKNLSRKWIYEADMLRALQQDEQLCMDAVCALYRQHVVARKSNGRSKIGGFGPVDLMSGCALAEYLIGGDKELRLRKSVFEVKKQCPDAISQCRKLATSYVEKLFEIYCAADDPFFGQP